MGWGDEYKDELAGKYAAIKEDGDSLTCVIAGEPRVANCTWAGNGYELDPEGTKRIAVNVYIPAEDAMKILQGPGGLARALFAAQPGPRDIFTITRLGSGKGTKWKVKKEGEIGDVEFAALNSKTPHDLGELWGGQPSGGGERDEDDIPF